MNRRILILAILLGVQVLLGAALNFDFSRHKPANEAMLSFKRDQVDRIEVAAKDGSTQLVLKDGSWRLPGYFDLPATADGVKVLYDQLDKFEPNTPVATTADAQARFKVAPGDFERKIVFSHGDKVLATVYVGTGAARNRSMVRVDGSNDIREEPIAIYELQTDPAQWVNKTLLNEPADQIARIDVDGMTLTREATKVTPAGQSAPAAAAAGWTVSGVPAGHHFDAAAADKLAQLVAKIGFDSVLGNAVKPEYGLAVPALKLSLTLRDGRKRDYLLGKPEKESWYALQVSDRKEIFKLLPYEATPLLDAAKPVAPVAQSAPAAKPMARAKKK